MATWILAAKDLRLLLRDPRAALILLGMPLVFVLGLGLILGEGFGQKPDDRLRVSVVDLDEGYWTPKVRAAQVREATAWLTTWHHGSVADVFAAAGLAHVNHLQVFPPTTWAKVVQNDLAQTAGIRLEVIHDRAEAEQLTRGGRRAAVLVFGPDFSKKVTRCSFLAEGINPFYHDGINLKEIDAKLLQDPTQATAASIIDQAVQVSLFRVVLPWMIGRAFERIGDPAFIDLLSREKVKVPVPGLGLKIELGTVLGSLSRQDKQQLAAGMQNSMQGLFPNYNLTAKTWASLNKAADKGGATPQPPTLYQSQEGAGFLKRGALRYQLLVPSSLVMFSFFMVLTMGWLFVSERRQGTLKRLRAAPLTRWQIVLGKLLPCYVVSVAQGFFLLAAGKVVFGMTWGPDPWLLVPVVLCTSLAAMGLALLVAALARTEAQVFVFGTPLVIVLALVSGSLLGDRALMPETVQRVSRVTPHAWALDAYRQLLTNPTAPDLALVWLACGVLVGFGVVFVGLAWWTLQLE
jgi:ABC-type multidrug transport system permease subunit